jgi:hypothetical protein
MAGGNVQLIEQVHEQGACQEGEMQGAWEQSLLPPLRETPGNSGIITKEATLQDALGKPKNFKLTTCRKCLLSWEVTFAGSWD